jgi:hypothetical protein
MFKDEIKKKNRWNQKEKKRKIEKKAELKKNDEAPLNMHLLV